MRFGLGGIGLSVIFSLATALPPLLAERIPGRFIVELETEPVAEHMASLPAARSLSAKARASAADSHRASVVAEQTRVRGRLSGNNVSVVDSVNTVANALIVDAPDAAAAAQLASVQGVKRVLPVRRVHMLLDHAIVLHHVPEAWAAVGADRAGAGVKIAIIDSGIDVSHPAFRDSALSAPSSFPRVNASSDLVYTNNKIIVARSYVNLLPARDPDRSARDRVGHGTALAMTAAGTQNKGPLATITGVAPNAWLGSYKIFGTPGVNDTSSDDAILKAIDDAVADGMDVISLSFGTDTAPRLADDIEVQAVERAAKAGVIVVAAAGNNGPDLNTISSPATAPSAIAVGATTNDRTFGTVIEVSGFGSIPARLSDQPAPETPVSGPLADVTAIDQNGLACDPLPTDSLKARVALILRGTCTFEVKLTNAQRAGAVGAVVYAAADSPDPIAMAAGSATLPAEMIGNDAGRALRQSLADNSSLTATLRFDLTALPIRGNLPVDFSSAGPNVDFGIKPDLSAVGSDVYTATQSFDSNGEMYDPSGYILVDGTSFSTPLVAGAAALIRAARPGLTVDQYRSLLINNTSQVTLPTGASAPLQKTGSGILDVNASVRSTIASLPTSIGFGTGTRDPQLSQTMTLSNVGSATEVYSITAATRSGGPSPYFATNTVEIPAGGSVNVPVSFSATALSPGTYEGWITVTGSTSGTHANIPWWYAVPSSVPAVITILDTISSGRRGTLLSDAVSFRITDLSGIPITDITPEVSVVSGSGTVRAVRSEDDQIPGMFGLDLRLGATAGTNVFRIQAGDITLDITITGR